MRTDEVHVWSVAIEAGAAGLDAFRSLMSPDELDRANRFRFDRHRRQFIVTRGVLRTLLASRLERPASDLRFVEGPHGKPGLADAGTPALEFNVAHSHGMAVVALATGSPVGVDIERIRPEVDLDGIARRFFAPSERDELALVDPVRRVEAFFACWSRKEAVLKAVGTGISGGLTGFAVSCDPGTPARLVTAGRDRPPPGAWTLADLRVPPGFRAAVAVMAPGVRLVPHLWPAPLTI